jgi:DnaJ-class molecular chaperone
VGDDIHTTEWITISQAALGTQRLIETLWGQKDFKIPEGSQDGSTILLKSEVLSMLLRVFRDLRAGATTSPPSA